ncbi:MAG: methyltransferase [Cyanobacteria bacterium 13_1_40CM_2_61_4]|nr:MAG: methyltransferase [Cyanobacteria bacterium 13_1_40CM_2_61_4]
MANYMWHNDPRHLAFLTSRYKFVAKMLSGSAHVLEVGCADGFGTRIVQQEVGKVTATDFDPLFVEDARRRMEERWKFDVVMHDMVERPFPGKFDGAYAMDVIEHIPSTVEDRFVKNIVASLEPHGVLILGSPSKQSQAYASEASKAGHVNCKDGPGLKAMLKRHFQNTFVFSMNDEVVHTGYYPMAQYLIGLACGKHPS